MIFVRRIRRVIISKGAKNGEGTSKTKGKRETNQQGGTKGLNQDLNEEELYSMGEDSDSDDNEGKRYRHRYSNAEKDMQNHTFKLGMRFSNIDEYREAMRNHVIPQDKVVKFKPSGKIR